MVNATAMRYGDGRTDCLASTEGDDFSVRLTKENVDDDGNEQQEEDWKRTADGVRNNEEVDGNISRASKSVTRPPNGR